MTHVAHCQVPCYSLTSWVSQGITDIIVGCFQIGALDIKVLLDTVYQPWLIFSATHVKNKMSRLVHLFIEIVEREHGSSVEACGVFVEW